MLKAIPMSNFNSFSLTDDTVDISFIHNLILQAEGRPRAFSGEESYQSEFVTHFWLIRLAASLETGNYALDGASVHCEVSIQGEAVKS